MAVSEEVVEVTVREFDASSLVTVTLARSRHSALRALRGRWQEQYRQGEERLWGYPRGHLFHIQESGYKPASSHCEGIRAHSALACGKSLWSNKWHWFCRAGVFVAVCILILSIFDMSGRGWAVMWKMTPLCQRAKAKTQQGTLPLKQCPLPSHITVYYFLTVVSLCNWHLQKRMQRLRLPFFSPPFVAQAQNTQTQTHTHTHTSWAIWVYECNLVFTLSLLWVSVVCCASEMKAGLSNNSEFNTSTSPLMRVPCVCSRLISAAPVGEEARKGGRREM